MGWTAGPVDASRRVALVTGAASPIGAAIVARFVTGGYYVIASDHPDRIDRLTARWGNESVQVSACDLADSGTTAAWAESLTAQARIDVIVHNAALTYRGAAVDVNGGDVSGWQDSYMVNVISPALITAAVARKLQRDGCGGAVVFITSLHTERVRGIGAYATSKAGAGALARELADALAPKGIRVNSVQPGAIAVSDPAGAGAAVVPAGQVGAPADVANAVAFLADADAARYIVGAELTVDGGLGLYTWLHHLGRVGN